MSAPSDSRRMPQGKSKTEVVKEAVRLGHELGVRAHAVETSPHPLLALEQLEAELDFACHLCRDVRRLIEEQQKVAR
jgi:hypothetical protein